MKIAEHNKTALNITKKRSAHNNHPDCHHKLEPHADKNPCCVYYKC